VHADAARIALEPLGANVAAYPWDVPRWVKAIDKAVIVLLNVY